MAKILISNQEEFDRIKIIQYDDEVIFESNSILVNCVLEVYGILRLKGNNYCDRSNNRYILLKGNGQVHSESWSSSQVHIVSMDSSQVHIVSRDSSQVHIVSMDSSQVHSVSWDSSQVHIVSRDSSQVHSESRDSSQVHSESMDSSQVHSVSWDSSQVHSESWGSSRVHSESWDSSQVHSVSWGSSQVHSVSWDSSQVHSECYNYSIIFANRLASLYIRGYSVALLPDDFVIKINKEDTCVVQRYKVQESFFERNRVKVENGVCVLYKKVSKKYKTQEDTRNETVWTIGSIVEHKQWEPTGSECGEGKFHACSRPYFCDEFRNNVGDKYIAIEVRMENVYEWKNPEYPHKIGFRKGLVVYECDKYGNKKEGYCE